MRTTRWLVFAALAAGAAVAGCGGEESGERAAQASPDQLFLVRPQGPTGPLVAYGMPSARERFRLPSGMSSADGDDYYAARVRGAATQLQAFDPRTGAERQSFSLEGRWRVGGVSPSGRWVAISGARAGRTAVAVVDATSGRVARRLTLRGDFDVETVSADGSSLFLVEHLAGGAYRVRLYDLGNDVLVPGALRSKASDVVMAGYAWGGVATPDGQWLLTLYLSTRRDVAFVHALNLPDKFPLCIDLPSGDGDVEKLKAYALALSPDGRSLYAVNPALGVVTEIALHGPQVIGHTSFRAEPRAAGARTQLVVSPDGSRLYFANGRVAWSYDFARGTVKRLFANGKTIAGLGVSRNGRSLFVASPAGRPLAVDARTGAHLTA